MPGVTSSSINSAAAALSDDSEENGIENNAELVTFNEDDKDEDMVSLRMLEDHSLFLLHKQIGEYLQYFTVVPELELTGIQENSLPEEIPEFLTHYLTHKSLLSSSKNS